MHWSPRLYRLVFTIFPAILIKHVTFLIILLHICLVNFISFISYTKVHLIHFVIHFHLISIYFHFIDHSPSHSHLTYLVILILNHISIALSLPLINQFRLWTLAVPLDKVKIWNTYCITWNLSQLVILLLVTSQESQNIPSHYVSKSFPFCFTFGLVSSLFGFFLCF